MPKLEMDPELVSGFVVGERSNSGEALTVRSGGAVGSENVGLSSAQC